MTPQIKLVGIGAVAFLVSKFYFKHDTTKALLFGSAAISTVAVLTAHNHPDK